MSILEVIEKKLETIKNDKCISLWIESKKIVSDTINHNKLIITQMNLFDLHDEEHSSKILEIEALLLENNIYELSFTELVLLYLSAYLHDSAMALPQWEYKALEATEGTECCYDGSIPLAIRNDLKPVQKYIDIRKIVCINKDNLFDFAQAAEFVFAPPTEEEIIDDISSLILEYEEFRNGFYEELRHKQTNVKEYIEYSRKIRMEFIRQTHHIRVEKNVKRIMKRFTNHIGELEAKKITDELAKICRSHGENLEYLKELTTECMDFDNQKYNVQFLAIMLRLGDIIHFEKSRAPISLFAEKQINDPISIIHWDSKKQDLKYKIFFDSQYTVIEYYAFCKNPESYYFIQDYIDWIDVELSNYYHLKNCWQTQRIEKYSCYDLPLAMCVERSGIKYDNNIFIPDRKMKFVLNQTKILEMLAGVQLYQDRLLCLRELYQNALDASKCMRASNEHEGIIQDLQIIFGLGKEVFEGKEQRFIYCLDHGTGMDDYIIKNYLLQIGTSYYKSSDFMKANAEWKYCVVPTSQFGIGLLSGYMIATTIGITSVYYKNKNAISCVIGNKEHFYYTNPQREDLERIGPHGTLIKLYLKKEYSLCLNNKKLPKFQLLVMNTNHNLWKEYVDENIIKNNLNFIIFNHVGIVEKDIPVLIEDENGQFSETLSAVETFDFRNYSDITAEDVEKLWSEYHYLDGSINPYKEVVENRDRIIDYTIEVQTENIQLYSHIALPNKEMVLSDIKLYDYCHFLGNKEGSIYVDGIYVEKSNAFSDFSNIIGRDILENSIVNFIGNKRPALSIDRKSIISFPNLDDEVIVLREKFIDMLVEKVKSHFICEKYKPTDFKIALILDILVRRFPCIAGELIQKIVQNEINIDTYVDEGLRKSKVYFKDLFKKNNICFQNVNFKDYREITRQLIIGRLLGAKHINVDSDSIKITGKVQIIEFPFAKREYHSHYQDISLYTSIIKADKWAGDYKEYDLVNTLWPVVSPFLYKRVNDYDTQEVLDKMKTIGEYSNSIAGIANLDPVMIDPDIGISNKQHDLFSKKQCYVGVIENIQNNFFLMEFMEHKDSSIEKKEAYVLYVFYKPRALNELEKKRFLELKKRKKEYCKGLKNGFSVLFLGGNNPHYVIKAGKVLKEEMINAVPDSFWDNKITYLDVKGKIVHKGT